MRCATQWLFISGKAVPPSGKTGNSDASGDAESAIAGDGTVAFAPPRRPSMDA
jgi:hypothetical protein